MTTTITITTAPPPGNESIAFMLTILEVALTSVTVALAVLTIAIAILAFWGARSIRQAAINVARESVQEAAAAEVEKLLDKPQIRGIIKEHVERVAEELFREARGKSSSAQPGVANTEEEKND